KVEVSRGEVELETLREEAHRRRSRLASLNEIQERYESFQKGVRAIMQKRRETEGQGQLSGIKGVVADIVQPPPELETAVEAVLGDRLGSIIVDSHDVGVEAIEFLKARSEGRSSFIPVALRDPMPMVPMAAAAVGSVVYDAGGGVSVDVPTTTFVPWPTGDGVRGPLLDLIGYDRQYDKVATYLLGDVLVVENLQRALELWRHTETTKTIVTLDGEVVDPRGVVTGGSRESSVGVLEQKREIRELEQVVARLEIDCQETLARHVATKQDLADVSRTIDELATVLRADEVAMISQQKDLDRTSDEVRRLEDRHRALEVQSTDLQRALSDSEMRAATAA